MLNHREMPHKAKPTANQLKFPEKEGRFIYFSHPIDRVDINKFCSCCTQHYVES